MTSVLNLLAIIAFALPGFPPEDRMPDAAPFAAQVDVPGGTANDDIWAAAHGPKGAPWAGWTTSGWTTSGWAIRLMPGAFDEEVWNQVRIEQRVIIRINPRDAGRDALVPQVQPVVQSLNPPPRQTTVQVRVRERKASACMPALGIAAVQPITDGRLMFYMRDRRMIAAGLEKACSARDFYLGFYMSKTADGQLCVGRDPIHSRAGTTCKLKEVREYVPVE